MSKTNTETTETQTFTAMSDADIVGACWPCGDAPKTVTRIGDARAVITVDGQAYAGAHYVTHTKPGERSGRNVQCPTRGAAIRLLKTLAEHEPSGTGVSVYPGRIGEVDANLPIAWIVDAA